ncbi:MAG: phosphatidylglycerophosphatase A [Synergistaceae bacterium]|nr:phosphatidylglycerophosphatase A [Synergistaceae bacterium]MBQ6738589.1 phosphatidylglycerophosphatase A [Synergistaceae bacterium]MBQ7069509.1 phosphatidylglycerophosphatase A [Synergistaceae bacterium]MBR0076628.1 phosphatidylglycerophosphatase A [Synergistaceae bacterium]MBR0080817.1 phosphatidylglycerophosphatase A [Synergistaceae bacterium]
MKNYPYYVWIASLFGLGFIPSGMPGTVSSAFACVVSIFVDVPMWAIIAVTLIGVYVTGMSEKFFQTKDPSFLNIDELPGMWLSIYLLPKGFIIPGFFLFRIIDILKPFPVSLMEKLPGGWGIMADDVVGGILVNIFLQALNAYFYNSGWIYGLIS